LIYNEAANMARDQAYYEAEKKTQTMIEGLEDCLDWGRANQGNLSIKKIMVKTNKGGKHAP
jgi:hypothetical protein